MSDVFKCTICGFTEEDDKKELDHCPKCLSKRHEVDFEGYECGGVMEPVSVWVKPNDEWEIIFRCKVCGEMESSSVFQDDNYLKLISIASKPLAEPPFPIEKIEELNKLAGTSGSMGEGKNEQGK